MTQEESIVPLYKKPKTVETGETPPVKPYNNKEKDSNNPPREEHSIGQTDINAPVDPCIQPVTQVGKIIDYPCEKPKIDELEGKLLVESSENPVTQVDKIIDDSCEKPMNGELEGELTAELSNKTVTQVDKIIDNPCEEPNIDELKGKPPVELSNKTVTQVDKKIEYPYSVNTDIKKPVDPFIQTVTLEDSISPLNKELMNAKTGEELSDKSSNKTETQDKMLENDKDIGNKSLPGNIGSPSNSVPAKESCKYSSPCDVSQSNSKAELNEVPPNIKEDLKFNIKTYTSIIEEFDKLHGYKGIYLKYDLDTEEDEEKLNDLADKIYAEFTDKLERAKREYEQGIADFIKENKDFEKDKNKAEELTKESNKTHEELTNLINQADNNLVIKESEKEIVNAYMEMKKDIEECLGGQTEDIGNMITILLNELICCDFTGLDTIEELFKSSGHESWTLQARKQAVCFMIEPQFDNVKTAKTAESVEDNPLEKFNKIIGAFQKKYNSPFPVKNEDKLHDAIKKADLLSKYAVAGEHYFPKGWTYEGLEGLQPKSTKSTQVNESINNAPTDNTIKVEAISTVKMSQGENQDENQGDNPNESQSQTQGDKQGEAQKHPSKQLNEDELVIEKSGAAIKTNRKKPENCNNSVTNHPSGLTFSPKTDKIQESTTDNRLVTPKAKILSKPPKNKSKSNIPDNDSSNTFIPHDQGASSIKAPSNTGKEKNKRSFCIIL